MWASRRDKALEGAQEAETAEHGVRHKDRGERSSEDVGKDTGQLSAEKG